MGLKALDRSMNPVSEQRFVESYLQPEILSLRSISDGSLGSSPTPGQ